MKTRHVIVGNGPAGIAAAEAIRRRDSEAEIQILGDERCGYYSRPGLAYLLAGTIPEKQLFSRPEADYRRLRLRRVVARVMSVEPARHELILEGGQRITFDRLLLAVGARAVRPEVPGIDLPGVVCLDTLADAQAILRLARRARRAVVVGGGITAVELAEGLASRGVEVHYLLRKDRYWGSVLDAEESRMVERRLEEEGIVLHHNSEMAQVLGAKGRVAGVALKDGRRLPCSLLAVAIGILPRTELALAAGIAVGRGIRTDERLRTSVPDIYAAGDVAEVLDPDTGAWILDSLWSTALRQGTTAGANMAGADQPYRRGTSFNVTRVGGVTMTLIGAIGSGARDEDLVSIARGDSESWRGSAQAFAIESQSELSRLRVLVGEDRLVGAVVMGEQGWSRPLQRLIADRVDISAVRPTLVARPDRLPEVLNALWREVEGAR